MAKKEIPNTVKPYKPSNAATITDYNRSMLSDVVKNLKVGTGVKLLVSGEVTRLEERYSSNKNGDSYYDNRCEIALEPESVKIVAGTDSMVSQMRRETRAKGGSHYGSDEEGE